MLRLEDRISKAESEVKRWGGGSNWDVAMTRLESWNRPATLLDRWIEMHRVEIDIEIDAETYSHSGRQADRQRR